MTELAILAAWAGLCGGLLPTSRPPARSWVDAIRKVLAKALLGAAGGLLSLLPLLPWLNTPTNSHRFAVMLLAFVAGYAVQSLAPKLAAAIARLVGATNMLDDLENEIRAHIDESSKRFHGDATDPIWVVKYILPKWLASFMSRGRLGVSATPGFTWGDGVYVAPLDHAYSSVMYGRAVIVGLIDRVHLQKVYNAAGTQGLELYQRWIRTQVTEYDQLTTTIHADVANQKLRNVFRTRFSIDLVVFVPDETPAGYLPPVDRWYCVTDWTPPLPNDQLSYTARVRDCRFVGVVGEEFSRQQYSVSWPRYFAPTFGTSPVWDDATSSTTLPVSYMKAHAANAPAGAATPHPVNRLVNVRPLP